MGADYCRRKLENKIAWRQEAILRAQREIVQLQEELLEFGVATDEGCRSGPPEPLLRP